MTLEDRLERALRGTSTTDTACAKGDASLDGDAWTCKGRGRRFSRSPNQHIYAARKRIAKAVAS